jgi:DNA-binding winged helix-turn-helix (wHTH) protein/tetratricopeptide (TPR) repeat protein
MHTRLLVQGRKRVSEELSAEVFPFEGATRPISKRAIVLAHEEPFKIGNLTVTPATRQISTADGTHLTLEPRVMQVLVALTLARGAIVSRDDLIRMCWHGTVVGDDSINRPISLLRRVLESAGQGGYRIETIPRVGYRLIDGTSIADAPISAPTRRIWVRPMWLGLVAVPLALAVGIMAWPPAPQGPSYSISLKPFRTPAAASNFDDQLSSELTAHDVPTIGGRNAITLTGSVEQNGADFTVNARLVAPTSRAIIWSGAIRQPSADPRGLAEAARSVGLIAQCAVTGANDAGTLAPELLSLYVRTCELGARGQNALGVRVARELTIKAPGFAAGWFALSHHSLALFLSAPRQDPLLRNQAVTAAERLIALRPNAQDGYISEALALDPRQRMARERLLRRAVGLDPLFVDRAQISLADFLWEVGRSEEALQLDRIIAQQNPDRADAQGPVFLAAAALGRLSLVDQAIERMKALDPDGVPMMLWRRALWRGDWVDAERYLPRRDALLDRARIGVYRAMASGDAREQRAAARKVMDLPDGCCVPVQAELLTQLGRRGDAIALLEKQESAGPSGTPPPNIARFLADPAMRSLWHDRAIESLLRRIGLIDYWHSSGTRPDVCRESKPPAFCRLLTI